MFDNNELPERFFSEARLVFQSHKNRIDFGVDDIRRIADDPAATGAFMRMFRTINDPDLCGLIIDHLQSVAERLSDTAEETDIDADLIDRAGLGVTVSVTVAAIAAIVSTAGAVAPIAMLCVGAGGTAICGIGRRRLKRRSAKDKSAARKIRRLAEHL